MSGETVGMSGGVLHVRGDAGERAGDRLRRGVILIEGRAGAYAGSRMIAGTLAIGGEAGDLPGYLMGRGTILLGRGATLFSPTFGDCGEYELVAARLLADYVAQASAKLAGLFRRPLRRLAGDLAALGKGEILLPRPRRRDDVTRSVHSRIGAIEVDRLREIRDAGLVDARGIDVQARRVGALKKGAAQIRAAGVRLAQRRP